MQAFEICSLGCSNKVAIVFLVFSNNSYVGSTTHFTNRFAPSGSVIELLLLIVANYAAFTGYSPALPLSYILHAKMRICEDENQIK